MPAAVDAAPEVYVYRRVFYKHWNRSDETIEPPAFVPQPGQSLSVFNASIVPHPRFLFEHYIKTTLAGLDDPNVSDDKKEKIRQRRDRGELTPEYMYHIGWRIAKIPLREFLVNGFTVDPPDADGHQNIIGRIEDFQIYATIWIEKAHLLSEEKTLAVCRRERNGGEQGQAGPSTRALDPPQVCLSQEHFPCDASIPALVSAHFRSADAVILPSGCATASD